MSTRGTIKFYTTSDGTNDEFKLALYNHWSSNPERLGYTIGRFLRNIKVVNGFSFEDKIFEVANGFDDLVLQFVIFLKENKIGNVYLASEDAEEEWNYTIVYHTKDDSYIIYVESYDIYFQGTLGQFIEWVDKYTD